MAAAVKKQLRCRLPLSNGAQICENRLPLSVTKSCRLLTSPDKAWLQSRNIDIIQCSMWKYTILQFYSSTLPVYSLNIAVSKYESSKWFMIKFSRLIFINAVKLPSHTIKQLFYISFEISCIAIQYADF